jgi:hypothetical protein
MHVDGVDGRRVAQLQRTGVCVVIGVGHRPRRGKQRGGTIGSRPHRGADGRGCPGCCSTASDADTDANSASDASTNSGADSGTNACAHTRAGTAAHSRACTNATASTASAARVHVFAGVGVSVNSGSGDTANRRRNGWIQLHMDGNRQCLVARDHVRRIRHRQRHRHVHRVA